MLERVKLEDYVRKLLYKSMNTAEFEVFRTVESSEGTFKIM